MKTLIVLVVLFVVVASLDGGYALDVKECLAEIEGKMDTVTIGEGPKKLATEMREINSNYGDEMSLIEVLDDPEAITTYDKVKGQEVNEECRSLEDQIYKLATATDCKEDVLFIFDTEHDTIKESYPKLFDGLNYFAACQC